MSAMAVSREFVSSSLLKLALLNQKAEASIGALAMRSWWAAKGRPVTGAATIPQIGQTEIQWMVPHKKKKSDKLHHPKTTQGTITLF